MTGLKRLIPVFCLSCALHASVINLLGTLSGADEVPPNASPAGGSVSVLVDTAANTIIISVAFIGLTAPDTAAHIHCCIAQGQNTGVATAMPALFGFPLGVTLGTFIGNFSLLDPTFYNPAFIAANGGTVAGAEAQLVAGLIADEAYFNIHTSNYPGGEIRAFLITPESATSLLVGLVFVAFGITRLRRFGGETYPPKG